MPISIPRLRTWFALLAVATVVVVAGFYFYAQIRLRRAVKQVPQKLGINIQQSTEGFSLSKSEGGRTLFTIKASKAVQYKEGGKASLQDVNIVVYGKDSNRFDQIYGSGFEYDPQNGTVAANGEVHIDLEANAEGPGQPDQQTPKELKNPIHLKTSGLVFNQKTGIAQTKDVIEFRVPQAAGSAQGATYDSKANVLTLKSNVKITTPGERASTITAASGTISKEPREMVLQRVRVEQGPRLVEASTVRVAFRPDNSVEDMVATGEVRYRETGANAMSVSAPRADVRVAQKNLVQGAVFSGGVKIEGTGDNAINGAMGKLALDFGAHNKLSHVRASENVRLQQAASKKQKDSFEIASEALDLNVENNRMNTAETSGAAKVTLVPANSKSGEQTVVTAGKFRADFDERGRLKLMRGEPNARVVSSVPGQPDKVTTSRTLAVQFAPGGGVLAIAQEGDFEYHEATTSGARAAFAEKARYNPVDEMLALSGSPRVVEGGMTITAQSMRINRRTGDAFAEGDVKTSYSELKPEPNGALLATAEPVHVTSRGMSAQRQSGVARFTGGARLWQGANIIEAPAIEFDRTQRAIVAQGTADKPVSCVLVQADKSGKTTPVLVTAAKLTYTDLQRRARFSGGVLAKGADLTISANTTDILLNPTGTRVASGPSQLNQIISDGNIVIQQPNRRATGQKLVYTAQDGRFVLTGGPPMVADAEHGTIRGDSLTFYSRDDRVVVESTNSSRTVTRTRVSR